MHAGTGACLAVGPHGCRCSWWRVVSRHRLLSPGLLSREAAGGDSWKERVPLVQMQGSRQLLTACSLQRSPHRRDAVGKHAGLSCRWHSLFVIPWCSTARTDPGWSCSWRRLPSPGAHQIDTELRIPRKHRAGFDVAWADLSVGSQLCFVWLQLLSFGDLD